MPYLITLFIKKENDFISQVELILLMGSCVMNDISINDKPVCNEEIIINYEKSVCLLKENTKYFLKNNIDNIKKINKYKIYISILSILGDREVAFILSSICDECYLLCNNCNYCDE